MNAKQFFFLAASAAVVALQAAKLEIVADHSDALYACGTEATICVKALDDMGKPLAAGKLDIRLDDWGTNVFLRRSVDLAKENPAHVKGMLAKPGFLRLVASGVVSNPVTWSVGYEPERIVQGAPCPADFDAYWAGERARLAREVPLDAKAELQPELSKGAYDFYRLSFATFHGKRVYGFLTAPKKKGKWPVRVNVPGAGPWAWTLGGSGDAINLMMNVFPFDPPKTKEEMKRVYDKYTADLAKKFDCGGYSTSGAALSREEYFYHDILLGIDRAVEWVAARDDVDLSDFTYSGGSQGGMFGFYLCGLNKRFTKGVMHVPAGCDHFGFKVGRPNGWPQLIASQKKPEARAAAEKVAPYFDGCNFAARVTIPVRVSVGFSDTCCAPSSVYAAYNAIPAIDKRIIPGVGMPHSYFPEISALCEQWRTSRPSEKTTAQDLKNALKHMPAGHPRLFTPTRDAFARVRAAVARDPQRKKLADAILREAEKKLAKPRPQRGMEGFRMRGQHEVSSRLIAWASAYQLTLEKKWFVALRDEALAACAWTDWNPKHYLDTAQMQLGLAIAYDWAYDLFTEEERRTIRKAIVEKGLTSMNTKGTGWWRICTSNWQQVCWQGACIGALAIWEDEKDVAERILLEAIQKLHLSAEPYGPSGAYPEGPSYWSYGTTRFIYLLDLFHNAFGFDFGLSEVPGFMRTGEYRVLSTGPSGRTFNYSDNGDGRGFEAALLWLSQKTGRAEVAAFERERIAKSGFPAGFGMWYLFWYDWDGKAVSAPHPFPLDYSSQGHTPIVCARSSQDADAAFLAAKGGRATYNHAHMDDGTFVFDLDGVRWAEDLGSQGYYSIEKLGMNLWTSAQDGDRWKVFRQSPKSHNVVTLDLGDFNVKGFASVSEEKSTSEYFSAKIDLGPIYAGGFGANAAVRRVRLDRASRMATIADHFEGVKEGVKARWAMVTGAKEIKIEGNVATLSNGKGKSCRVVAALPADVCWEVLDIAKGPNSWDCANNGRKMLACTQTVSASGAFDFRVTLGPAK